MRKLLNTITMIVFFLAIISAKSPKYKIRSSHSSYNYGIAEPWIKPRQNSNIFVTTGVPRVQGQNQSMATRREIRELEKDEDMWTLYILALDRLQNIDQTDKSSYYSLAGIHGRPFKPYDGVEAKPGNQNNGYCTHVSILFPTWHRPYLALYEQILYQIMQDIVQRYPEGSTRERYAAAAVNFRIPYWDWAASRSDGGKILPNSIAGSSNIKVNGPFGTQLIANPLFTYKFQPLDPTELPNSPFNQYLESMRYPDNNTSSAISRNGIAIQILENSAASIRSRIYTILTNYDNYLAFSNEGYRAEALPSEQDSLEAIHDQIHSLIGGGGHMSYIDYAGFDPVFFLHHAMVDRCFALWQALNPFSYVTPRIAVSNTFTMSAGQIQDNDTPLTPFYKDKNGNFWSSIDVRDTTALGYAYSETFDNNRVSKRQDVIMAINRLYGPSSGRRMKRDFDAQSISATGKYREWVANIQMHKSALTAPFTIYIFLGSFNCDPKHWSSEPNLAGAHTTFVKTMSTEENHRGSSQIVTAAIPLTNSLIKHMEAGELESLSVHDVRLWLSNNLSYRMSFLDDTEINKEDVPDLKISIASAEVRLPEQHSEMPIWGEMEEHMQVR